MRLAKFLCLLHCLLVCCRESVLQLTPPLKLIIAESNQSNSVAAPQVLQATETELLSLTTEDKFEHNSSTSVENESRTAEESTDILNARLRISLRLLEQLPLASQPTISIEPIVSKVFEIPVNLALPSLSNEAVDAVTIVPQDHVSMALVVDNNEPLPDPFFVVMSSEIGPGGDPEVPLGSITLYCETTSGQYLPNDKKQSPGWYGNVNWSDVDNDGWNPSSTKTTTAAPSATYTPDRDDELVPNGDPDLRKFVVEVTASDDSRMQDHSFSVTFGCNVNVYEYNTKASPVSAGQVFASSELSWVSGNDRVKTKTLWLEGQLASAAFLDTTLRIDYVGAQGHMISMPKKFDETKVTVFGVTTEGKYGPGGKTDDNDFSFTNANMSNNKLGIISFDGANPDLITHYFHNCMEMQGTVQPPLDTNSQYPYGYNMPPPLPGDPDYVVTFDANREYFGTINKLMKASNTWEHQTGFNEFQWTDDVYRPDVLGGGRDNTISTNSHIYYSDAPGCNDNDTMEFTKFQQVYNFRNYFLVSFYGVSRMASDMARWHSQVVLITNPNDASKLTRDADNKQKLGDGWITIPTAPIP